ncbi:MAG: hypothetical protein GWN00_10430 [Aliifodinibius sp.]|nr:hypothetical protein [Fodinibius sp.]NIV11590.1 hypothetical protein [Fodinibius sp.]NIY25204.1 hypothetical protein [Fodinibius sp.]
MSIIPVVIIVLLTYMSLLKNRLQRAEKITQNLTAQASHKTNSKIKLVSENNTDTLILSPEDLLVIQSSDNYSTIIWEEGLEIKKTLLRSTLKRLAAQIKFAHIVRCHRSYIVNLMRVYSVSGNANGYKLYLKGYPEAVPVARGYGKEVMQILERISS